jgi:hypothetical protein
MYGKTHWQKITIRSNARRTFSNDSKMNRRSRICLLSFASLSSSSRSGSCPWDSSTGWVASSVGWESFTKVPSSPPAAAAAARSCDSPVFSRMRSIDVLISRSKGGYDLEDKKISSENNACSLTLVTIFFARFLALSYSNDFANDHIRLLFRVALQWLE